MEMSYTFDLSDSQVEELKMLQKAMQKAAPTDPEYYTLERVWNFVMLLSSTQRINDAIENAAYHYDRYYDEYPYEYGCGRTADIMAKEKETGEVLSTAYPNPRIRR